MMLIRHHGQAGFIRATDHMADQAIRLGLEVKIDDRPRFSGQARMEYARERCLLSAEMMLRAHRAAPDLYRYIGER